MKSIFEELKANYPELKFELEGHNIYEDELSSFIKVSKFRGNKDFEVILHHNEDVEKLKGLPVKEMIVLDEFIGFYINDKVYVYLRKIGLPFLSYTRKLEEQPISIQMSCFDNELKISISMSKDDIFLNFVSLFNQRVSLQNTCLCIENYILKENEDMNENIRKIINSVLFDICYTYNMFLEPVSFDLIKRRQVIRVNKGLRYPQNEINLIYKNYIPELTEYYRTAERVDYLPFKYLCYYNIIEYFLDKSAYSVVSKKVKNILLKPDFHLKVDHYISQAVTIFKAENEKHINDKTKISRVISQFVEKDEFKEQLNDIGLSSYFEDDVIFSCNKEFKLTKLDYSSENQFITSLTNRIYSLRCSIVHSNPDFDEKKAIPFVATQDNLLKLRYELYMIQIVAKSIILKSSY